RQVQAEVHHPAAHGRQDEPLRPPHRQGNRRGPVVRALRAGLRIRLRRHRQEGRVLIVRSRHAWLAGLALCVGLSAAWPGVARAELPTFKLTFKPDGTCEPARLEVPAGRFKIELVNESNEPVEFESIPLRKEKVMGPGVSSFVVITISRPGEYPFFDD